VVRVFQEALQNAVKHGAAKSICARLRVDGGALQLEIVDDGSGFSMEQIVVGRGLPGMRARAAELGGRCEIDGTPGGGARVRLVLPMGSS
jgi:signal transduction histidine kinase